ncbi:transposase, IS5 family [Meinhardsimonia xiamenensis]|jgi:IS5 family transposase|uniref:Transposase, IS5 family n=1 Tax=Meinhardsimonia xiamenensis TaxID=990712 RepID=A0A1G9GI09_9RHOB|nr:IS5 family transposase [Meinhardsimonia xiamenensis]PRX31875.1 IS5 family transposase [Meinhardsimonia xiamenensis]SDL00314.1 transposase, IS5 family [Meinhardsimonia xiamenensis]
MRPAKSAPENADLFRASLEAILDPEHELIRLAALIDWERFDDAFGAYYHPAKGRRGLRTRLMVGLHLLKHMKGLSDEELCAVWLENPYFQAFCGETHFQHRLPFDRSSMTRWRKRIGAEEIELLLAETIRLALETGAVNERQLERITVDTTVQTKAVAHPTDSHLILRATEWLNRIAKRQCVKLRQSFSRVMVRARREAARLMHGRGHGQGLRWVGKMRTWLGRLTRDIRRKTEGKPELEAAFATALERAGKLLTQTPGDSGKLHALHAPEVECIGKGKARSRYEFGVKASFATTNERCKGGQFVLGARTLPGNPYDGHSLAAQIDQTERLTGRRVKRVYADRGYRGHGVEREGLEVILSHTRGITSPTIRREMRRRNAIEPVIGHMKADGLLERNHLAGPDGDAINALLCAAGHNLRLLARWLEPPRLWILARALGLRALPGTWRQETVIG